MYTKENYSALCAYEVLYRISLSKKASVRDNNSLESTPRPITKKRAKGKILYVYTT